MKREMMTSDVINVCGGRLIGPDAEICRQWRTDSRDIAKGNGFVAIAGANVDGHSYIPKAIENGATVILSQFAKAEEYSSVYPNITFIAVENTEKALTQIALFYIEKISPEIVGITGSVGKTTSRELLASALSKKYKAHAAIKSFNTIIGCSLAALSMPPDTEILILEMGTNHFGEISEMSRLFRPSLTTITDVVPAHLAGFGNIGGVLKAKMEICESRPNSLVYNADNLILKEAVQARENIATKIGVGYNPQSDIRITACGLALNEDGPQLNVSYEWEDEKISAVVPIFGKQHAYNIGYAYANSRLLGVDAKEIAAALAEIKPISGRGVCKKILSDSWVIDEAYNANPNSMRAALDNVISLANANGKKKIGVLGGMRELGKDTAYWHKEILLFAKEFDKLFLLGEEWNCGWMPSNAELFDNGEELKQALCSADLNNSIIVVKGSNYYGLAALARELEEL